MSTTRFGILGKQIGGIRLKVQSIQRYGWQGLAKCLAALEICDPACDADVEPHREKSLCFRAVAGETVHDAARSVGHRRGKLVVKIGEGVATVKKKRLASRYSHRQLLLESNALRLGSRKVAVVVKATLSNRHDLRALPEFDQLAEGARVIRVCAMGVYPRGREESARIGSCKLEGQTTGPRRCARGRI